MRPPVSQLAIAGISLSLALGSQTLPTPPFAMLAVAQTSVASPCPQNANVWGMAFAVAADGTIYLASTNVDSPTVWRFEPRAHGDAAPGAAICGPNTQMKPIKAMTSAGNELYVVGDGSIQVFASGATGDVAPIRFIGSEKSDDNKTGMQNSVGGPFQIVVGSDGTIYALDDKACHCQGDRYDNELFTFAPSANGDVAPSHAAVLRNPDPNAGDDAIATSIALDAKSRLYFLDREGNVIVSRPAIMLPYTHVARFDRAAGTLGSLALDRDGKLYLAMGSIVHVVSGITSGAPADVPLTGSNTRISDADNIATDAEGNIYVQNCSRNGAAILVFRPRSVGNVAPLYELGGPRTHLSCNLASNR
jgi:hypothetical protein